jgi:hypothetical protein
MHARLLALIICLAAATVAGTACSAEEDVVDTCDTHSGEPNDGCVPGYKCVARPEGEVCVPAEESALRALEGSAPAAVPVAGEQRYPAGTGKEATRARLRPPDSNLQFLRRLGYVSKTF